jgi:hypothetical protein
MPDCEAGFLWDQEKCKCVEITCKNECSGGVKPRAEDCACPCWEGYDIYPIKG